MFISLFSLQNKKQFKYKLFLKDPNGNRFGTWLVLILNYFEDFKLNVHLDKIWNILPCHIMG